MSKNKEELKALSDEIETVNKKLRKLTEEELEQVSGGDNINGITLKDIKRGYVVD